MKNKDLEAINDLKDFIASDRNKTSFNSIPTNENTDFLKLLSEKENIEERINKSKILDNVKNILENNSKEYINDLFEKINIPAGKNGIDGINGKDGLNGLNGSDGKDGLNGSAGEPGLSLIWKGEHNKNPKNPEINWIYRNSDLGSVLIYNGKKWQVLISDGENGKGGYGSGVGPDEAREIALSVSTGASSVTTTSPISGDGSSGSPIGLGEVDELSFDSTHTSANNPTFKEGLLFYDFAEKTLSMYNDQSDVTLQLGQEMHIRGVNKTGSTLSNGTVVSVSGAQGNRPKIQSVSATTNFSKQTLGIVTHNILDNQEGLVTTFGTIGDLDTSQWTIGTEIFLSTSGTLTSEILQAPFPEIHIGIVTVSHAMNGKILANIHIHETLEHLSNVNGTPPVQGSLLEYNSTSGYWDATSNTSAFATGFNIVSTSTDLTASLNDVVLVDKSLSAVNITIPTAVGNANKRVDVKAKTEDSNILTVSATSGNIDTNSNIQVTTGKPSLTFVSDGTDWWII